MKVIVAGSRTIKDYEIVKDAIFKSGFIITEIVSGGALGVDSLGEKYSNEVLKKKPKVFPAMWNDLSCPDAVIKINKFGKKYDVTAGHRRNQQMADYADALIVIIQNNSSGSIDMLKRMLKLNKPVYKMEIK